MKVGTKQIILLVMAVALIAVGFKYNDITGFLKGNTAPAQGNPQETGGKDKEGEGAEEKDAFVPSSLFFASKRLDRDTARSKTKETYDNITKDGNVTEAAKTEAYNKIMELAKMSESETQVEGLIRDKGFKDAYVCYSDIGELEVQVNTDTLTEEQVVQITDILIRYTDVDYSGIHIRKVA